MAFEGITVSAITQELRENLMDGRIAKIAQPETDELLLYSQDAKGPEETVYFCQCFPAFSLSDR